MMLNTRLGRRAMSAIAVLSAAALFVSGCGELTPDSLAYATNEAEPTIIRLATPRIAGLEDAIASWEREHPTAEVDVVVRNIDDHHRSLLDASDAGSRFDIVAFDATFGPEVRAKPELFIDLRQLDAGATEYMYLPARWAEGIGSDGEIIGLPIDVDSTALIVRTDLVGEAVLDRLERATSWCELIQAGDDFSDATNTAFLADGDDLLVAILSQTRTAFVDAEGALRAQDEAELQRAWDLVMLTIGEGPLHGDPCPEATDMQRISRNFAFDDSLWRDSLGGDDFAAVLTPWSLRRRVANAAPETAGAWTAIALPVDSPASNAGTSSAGGLHFGLTANSKNLDLAHDLLITIANPIVQRVTFANGLGPLPAAASPHRDDTVSSSHDDFFANARLGAVYGGAAIGRSSALAEPQRRLVIEEMLVALNQVESGGQTPAEAWADALERIEARVD
jgi:cellobiose transport system substrate-binding protein